MGVFGSQILEANNTAMSIEEFFDYFLEETKQIEFMFERSNLICELIDGNIIKEQTDDNNISYLNEMTMKPNLLKRLINSIKEIWNKFVASVTKAFDTLVETIYKMYMSINLTDKFISRYKNIVTYDNLKKAKEKGWKGMSIDDKVVLRSADVQDSKLYDNIFSDLLDDPDLVIYAREILDSHSKDEAKNKYEEFENKLNEIKDMIKDESKDSFIKYNQNSYEISEVDGVVFDNRFFAEVKKNGDGCYFPDASEFTTTKDIAENGQYIIKKNKRSNSDFIRTLKQSKRYAINDIINVEKELASSEDHDIDISTLYAKAMFEIEKISLNAMRKGIKVSMSTIKYQHRVAIKDYMIWLKAIKQYVVDID